ncbi:hypothetical protein [uncultured Deinococcus sp.]|uniref:hypothetical protein n=1 Tax=uncultured Deinococcus sp. TaxID=158789 RepID=UPI00258FDED5|nr:hypothetical protein [uncultured Deinococcus sp.]
MPNTGDWTSAYDTTRPVTTVLQDGSNATATVTARLSAPTGGQAGVLLLANVDNGAAYAIDSGYKVVRSGGNLEVQEWIRGTGGRSVSVAVPWAAGDWTLTVTATGTTLTASAEGQSVSMNNCVFRHFIPGLIGLVTPLACVSLNVTTI